MQHGCGVAIKVVVLSLRVRQSGSQRSCTSWHTSNSRGHMAHVAVAVCGSKGCRWGNFLETGAAHETLGQRLGRVGLPSVHFMF